VGASEEAFAVTVYLKNHHRDGDFNSTLLMSKTKLAPTKTLSVVKVELQAAQLGTQLATYVGDSITQPLVRRFFWVDNSCVRNWFRRIGEIQAATAPEELRYVPGGLNSSYLATRSSLISQEIPAVWFSGPEFLLFSA